MKTQKQKEIFEKFEWQLLLLLRREKSHLDHFKEKTEPYLGKLPENELINLYVQLHKHGRTFKNQYCIALFDVEYGGDKQRININRCYGNQIINIAGNTYHYQMAEYSFFSVYEEIRKACGYSKQAVKQLRIELNKSKPQIKNKKAMKANNKTVRIVEYSDKAIAVFGQTKPHKEEFKKLHGRFNPFLKNEQGEPTPGWVFSKKRTDQIKEIVNQ